MLIQKYSWMVLKKKATFVNIINFFFNCNYFYVLNLWQPGDYKDQEMKSPMSI